MAPMIQSPSCGGRDVKRYTIVSSGSYQELIPPDATRDNGWVVIHLPTETAAANVVNATPADSSPANDNHAIRVMPSTAGTNSPVSFPIGKLGLYIKAVAGAPRVSALLL